MQCRIPERQLEAGVWGIRQPRADCPAAAASQVDFVLVPGVAFTARCERLGYGGGFYDRFIRGLASRPALVAAAFSVQVVRRRCRFRRPTSVSIASSPRTPNIGVI